MQPILGDLTLIAALLFIVYGMWVLPIHLAVNYFLIRFLIRRRSTRATLFIAACINLVLFMPLVIEHNSMYGPLYFPWYLKPLLDKHDAVFSPAGVVVTLVITLTGSKMLITRFMRRAAAAGQA